MAARMAIPKDITFVTFDVYGTLIDWETGAYDAFKAEAERDGFTIERDEVIPLFHEIQQQIEAGSYELYAEVLRRTAVQIAKTLGWPLEPSRSGFLPDSVQRWPPFKETNPVLQKIAKKYKIGLISNIDDKLLGQTRRHIPLDFDLVVTAQQVRSYKPDPAHFAECERRIGGKKGWVHVAASYYYDIEPCLKRKIPVIWVNRDKETLESSQKKPDAEVAQSARGGEALGISWWPDARVVTRRRAVLTERDARPRAVCGLCHEGLAVHADVIVMISRFWQTTCTAVRAGDEGFVIDSPVYPGRARGARRRARAGRFPGLRAARHPRRLGPPARAARVPGGLARLRREHRRAPGRRARARPSASCASSTRSTTSTTAARSRWPASNRCRCPGACRSALGTASSSCTRRTATPSDGIAYLIPWLGVLVCGDYLSPVEIPWISQDGSVDAYLATLAAPAGAGRACAARSSPATAARSTCRRDPSARRGRRVPRGAA